MGGESIVNEDGEINLSSVSTSRRSGVKNWKAGEDIPELMGKRRKIETGRQTSACPMKKLLVHRKTKNFVEVCRE